MKMIPILILSFLFSCSEGGSKKSSTTLPGLPDSVKLGESSETDVQKELGSPKTSYDVKDGIVNTYEDGKAIKIENNVAKSYFREPTKSEVHLQHWLQAWKDKSVRREKIETSKNAHGSYEYQMICDELKTTIVFEENGQVKRVIHYEN